MQTRFSQRTVHGAMSTDLRAALELMRMPPCDRQGCADGYGGGVVRRSWWRDFEGSLWIYHIETIFTEAWGRVLSVPATCGQNGGQWTRVTISPANHLSVVLVTPRRELYLGAGMPLTFSSILCSPLLMAGSTLGSALRWPQHLP